MTNDHSAESLIVSTWDGVNLDIGVLVHAARTMRRNAFQAAEQESETAVARRDVSMAVFGMRIAVAELFGHDAAEAFAARLNSPAGGSRNNL